jgi:ABC-type nitrate/sulfonate/bicarbonate transport system substrate-binding protein
LSILIIIFIYHSLSSWKSNPSKRLEKGERKRKGQVRAMKRKRILIIAVGVVILFTVSVFFFITKPSVPEKGERARAGLFVDSKCALVYISSEQGFFKRLGLDLSIEKYQVGAHAVNDLLADKVDVAAAAEFVLVLQGFRRSDLRAIAAISATDSTELVARKDRGIEKPKDLKGKTIGFNKGTVNHFFLSNFLLLNNIRFDEVKTTDLKPGEMLAALSEGRVEAVIGFSNYTDPIKKALAGKIVSWPAQKGRDYYTLLIVKEEFLKARPKAIDGLLKGVIEAEAFLKTHERDAQAVVKDMLGVDSDPSWAKTRFRVSLDQALVTLMEDEGRWAIHNKLGEAKTVPDYLTFLSREGLKKIKPEAVGVN